MSERIELDERLRRAARTYRRLGNHTAEGMFLEAADTITELRGALQVASVDYRHLQDENAKLRELVQDMWPHVRHRSRMCSKCDLPCDTSDECLLYEPMRQRMRELGIEVEQ